MAPSESRAHRVAHFKQDNGELTHDVVPNELLDPDGEASGRENPRPPHDDPDNRVVGAEPLAEVPERDHPEDPVPGTLPRAGDEEPRPRGDSESGHRSEGHRSEGG